MGNKWRFRSWIAFTIFGVASAAFVGLWIWALHSPQVNGTPASFRQVLELNGSIWRTLSGNSRSLNHHDIPAGKKPRVNGDIGLTDEVDLANWELKTEGDPDSQPLRIHMDQIRALPRSETTAQFRCIEGWSDDIQYAGVKFSDFLTYYRMGHHAGPNGAPYRYVSPSPDHSCEIRDQKYKTYRTDLFFGYAPSRLLGGGRVRLVRWALSRLTHFTNCLGRFSDLRTWLREMRDSNFFSNGPIRSPANASTVFPRTVN
jgi:hypothetical protein